MLARPAPGSCTDPSDYDGILIAPRPLLNQESWRQRGGRGQCECGRRISQRSAQRAGGSSAARRPSLHPFLALASLAAAASRPPARFLHTHARTSRHNGRHRRRAPRRSWRSGQAGPPGGPARASQAAQRHAWNALQGCVEGGRGPRPLCQLQRRRASARRHDGRLAGCRGCSGHARARPGPPWRRRGVWSAAAAPAHSRRSLAHPPLLLHVCCLPAGAGHADVNIRADREDRVRLEVDTGEGPSRGAARAPAGAWGGCARPPLSAAGAGLMRQRAHACWPPACGRASATSLCQHLPACMASALAPTRLPVLNAPRCSWPRDGDEWKRLLSRAAPWIAAAAIAAASSYGWRENRVRARGAALLDGWGAPCNERGATRGAPCIA